jgi:hypothetical protein
MAARISHLRDPPLRAALLERTGASETYWPTITPARTGPFTAVTRTWKDPAERLATKSWAIAFPSGAVIPMSVFIPCAKEAPGPSSGMRKLTATPSTGRPVSSVTSTTIGREAFPPAW